MIKRVFALSALAFLLVSVSGCRNFIASMTEIEKTFFVSTAAIDAAESGENIRLTVVSRSFVSTGGEGAKPEQTKPDIISSEGRTIYEAVRNLNHSSYKHIFWGHLQFLLIGEKLARKNILDYLDFFIRNRENRLYVRMAVVIGSDADQVIRLGNTANDLIADVLDGLFRESEHMSTTRPVKIREAITKFDYGLSDVYLPAIHLSQETGAGSVSSKTPIVLDGFAVFKGKSLAGFMPGSAARGVNWAVGEVRSCMLAVKDSSGREVMLETVVSDSKITAGFKNDVPDEVTITVNLKSYITEQKSQMDIFRNSEIDQLEKKQAEIVLSEIESALSFARRHGVDIFEIGEAIRHKYPLKWEKIKADWEKIYPGVKINIKVKSYIARSFIFRQSIDLGGEKK